MLIGINQQSQFGIRLFVCDVILGILNEVFIGVKL
jgi:hypothetical protein